MKDKEESMENCGLISVTLIPGKVVEPINLENTSEHVMDEQVIGSHQHAFIYEGEVMLDQPHIAFYNAMLMKMVEGKAVDDVSLDVSKAFGTVSYDIYADKRRNTVR